VIIPAEFTWTRMVTLPLAFCVTPPSIGDGLIEACGKLTADKEMIQRRGAGLGDNGRRQPARTAAKPGQKLRSTAGPSTKFTMSCNLRLIHYPPVRHPGVLRGFNNLKNHFSHGNTRKTLKHSTFLERLFHHLAGDGSTCVKLMILSVFSV